MYHISLDPREVHSAKLLCDASQQIIRNENEKLNISRICQEAGVSRSTFYRLFDEVDDVLTYASEKILDDSLSKYAHQLFHGSDRSPASVYAALAKSYSKEIRWMIQNGKIGILLNTHRNGLRNHASVFFPEMDPRSEEFVYFLDMRFGLLLGAFTAWISTGQKATVEDIVSYAEQQVRFVNH